MTSAGPKRPRIAVVTPLFPLREEPYRGHPIYQTVLQLCELADVAVFCPVAVYPKWKVFQPRTYQVRPIDPTFQPAGVRTTYFDHLTLPVVGRLINGTVSSSRLLPHLERFRPDVVLAYWIYPYGYASLKAARKLGVPVVVGSRGSDLLRIPDRISHAFTASTVRQANAVVTVTEELRQVAIKLGASSRNVHVIANGCETKIFHPGNQGQARARFGIRQDAKLLVYVGHLYATKGLRELAAAFVELSREMPGLELACIGEGGLREELLALAESHGLDGRLHLPGAALSEGVAEWLRAADVFCLPSYSEGCPNVVVEALACGTPVVGTTVGGIPDLVCEDSGVLVPVRNTSRLKAAITQAIGKDWDRHVIANRSRRSWGEVAAETHRVCLEIAGGVQVPGMCGIQDRNC